MYLGQLSHVKVVQASDLQHDVNDRKKSMSQIVMWMHSYPVIVPQPHCNGCVQPVLALFLCYLPHLHRLRGSVIPRGGHFLCRVVRDARLYMGCFWEFFCTFSARWVPFFNKISVFFLQGGYLFWRKFLYLSNKMEPICKKFSVFYSKKLLHFTHKISVYFYKMGIFSRVLL